MASEPPIESALVEHDMCLATGACRRCGATTVAIATGARAAHCEPGVTGITWARKCERMAALISGPMVELPVYRLADLSADEFIYAPSITVRAEDFDPPSAA